MARAAVMGEMPAYSVVKIYQIKYSLTVGKLPIYCFRQPFTNV